jgi:hypothetical protein
MKVTPKKRKRLNATEARSRVSALHRDLAFVQRYLANDEGAHRTMDRLLRVIVRSEKGARAKERLRFEQTIRKVGEDSVSRLAWLVEFAQLKPEELQLPDPPKPAGDGALLLGLEDVQAFARGPFPERKSLGHSLRWPPHLEWLGTRKALARFAYDKLQDLIEGGTSIRPSDYGQLEIRLDRFGDDTAVHFEGDGPAAFAMEAARVLTEEGRRLRKCASQPCGRFFVQRKRGQFCSARCSHRERQRTWYGNLSPEERYEERRARYINMLPAGVKAKKRGSRERIAKPEQITAEITPRDKALELVRSLTAEEAREVFAQMLGGRQPNLVAKYLDGDPLAKAKVETIQARILATEHPVKPRGSRKQIQEKS